MPYYLQIETTTYGFMTAKCGSSDVADRLSNLNGEVAGENFCYVYDFSVTVEQPHNEAGAGNVSSVAAIHEVNFTLPDYEPLTAAALNILSGQDLIKSVVLNVTAVQKGNHQLLGQYTMQNGMLVGYAHQIQDQREEQARRQRGEAELKFKFQQIDFEDRVSQTQGSMTTNAV